MWCYPSNLPGAVAPGFKPPPLTSIGNKHWTFDDCVNSPRASSPFGRAKRAENERASEPRGWGGGGGWEEKDSSPFFARPSLPRLLSRAARACTFHDISKWKACFHARAYACPTMLKKIENHDCVFVVSNLYFKLICTSRSCLMTSNLRDSSPFRVAIDARRKKTREKASILKRVEEPPARSTHALA